MTQLLVEQMRSLTRRLAELDTSSAHEDSESAHKDVWPTGQLKGSLNTRRLADLLGINDFNNFSQAINKAKQGKADRLNRVQATELAMAFDKLLGLDAADTQKAMNMLKMVHSGDTENNEIDEDTGPDADHHAAGYEVGVNGMSKSNNPHEPSEPAYDEWEDGWKAGARDGGHTDDMMEDTGPDADHYESGYQAGLEGMSKSNNPHEMDEPAYDEWEEGWKAGARDGGHR